MRDNPFGRNARNQKQNRDLLSVALIETEFLFCFKNSFQFRKQNWVVASLGGKPALQGKRPVVVVFFLLLLLTVTSIVRALFKANKKNKKKKTIPFGHDLRRSEKLASLVSRLFRARFAFVLPVASSARERIWRIRRCATYDRFYVTHANIFCYGRN